VSHLSHDRITPATEHNKLSLITIVEIAVPRLVQVSSVTLLTHGNTMAQRRRTNFALLHHPRAPDNRGNRRIIISLILYCCSEGCKANFRVGHNTYIVPLVSWYLLIIAIPEHVFSPHTPLRHGMRFEPAFEGETSAGSRRRVGRRGILAGRF
jgi:hypothetical protein